MEFGVKAIRTDELNFIYLFICLLSLEGFLCGCLLYFNLYMLFSLKILIFKTKVCLIANRCDYIKAI